MNRRDILATAAVAPVLTVPVIPHVGLLPETTRFMKLLISEISRSPNLIDSRLWRPVWGTAYSNPDGDPVLEEMVSLGYAEKTGVRHKSSKYSPGMQIQNFFLTDKFNEEFIT